MQLHDLQRNTPQQSKKRVGRGGKRGKTSGRGHKGQNARAGAKKRPEERDIIKKIPKLRGRGINLNTSIQQKPATVSLAALEANFEKDDTATLDTLRAKHLAKRTDKRAKVLGTGTLSKALTFKQVEFSDNAKSAVEKAGGTIE